MSERKLPSPIYAAAGASEVFVEQLKKLPAKVDELRDRAKLEERFNTFNTTVRENVAKGVETVRGLDADKLRETASETANTLGDKAKEAGERARLTYFELVERGEHVADGERSPIKVIATIANPGNGNGAESTQAKSAPNPAAKKPTAKKTTTAKPAAPAKKAGASAK